VAHNHSPNDHHVSLDHHVVVSPNQISCVLGDEAVILNLESGVYYGLNPLASRVWELVQEPLTVRQILTSILSEYEIEESRCEHDLLSLVDQLQRWKLVELRNGNGSSPH
jgi:hypothetical protein